MTQGYTIKYHDPNTKEPYVRLQRDAKIVDVRINEPLRDDAVSNGVEGGGVRLGRAFRQDGRLEIRRDSAVACWASLCRMSHRSGIDSTMDPPTNRSILLCFVDLNQRPSRHCVSRIAADHERLGPKVAIVMADVSGMDETSLSRWSREEKIPFVVRENRTGQQKDSPAMGHPLAAVADPDGSKSYRPSRRVRSRRIIGESQGDDGWRAIVSFADSSSPVAWLVHSCLRELRSKTRTTLSSLSWIDRAFLWPAFRSPNVQPPGSSRRTPTGNSPASARSRYGTSTPWTSSENWRTARGLSRAVGS